MNIEVATLIITVIIAFVGYLITYVNNTRLEQHKNRLERVNRQLGELYGPMFALNRATLRASEEFRNKYRPGISFFADNPPPTEEELAAYRLWMTTVFMPCNTKLYNLVLSKSDLLNEAEMPQCLLDLCAHVASYQTVLEKWNNNDFSEHVALIDYPSTLNNYVTESYEALSAEQAKLLGISNSKFGFGYNNTKIRQHYDDLSPEDD